LNILIAISAAKAAVPRLIRQDMGNCLFLKTRLGYLTGHRGVPRVFLAAAVITPAVFASGFENEAPAMGSYYPKADRQPLMC